MKKITLVLLFACGLLQAQDLVKMTNGAELNIKIIGNNAETISFSRGIEGTLPYFISKKEIEEIRYENGTIEKPDHSTIAIEDAKRIVIEQIGSWATDKDGNKITASFEGNYLKISAEKGDYKKGMVFDLLKLIRFEETSYRREGFAFINIWAPILINEQKKEWDRFKLVMRIENHEQAAILTASLKQLNKTLKANR
ncbi:hypothetical protein [Flavobacterium sp.]|uniref:hypothetical protein n=1 Tax=Flavobacterium sp. TaxID=239 RepID=UPI0039E26452